MGLDMSAPSLKELRQQIDRLDTKILALINKRTKLALEVGKIKAREKRRYYVPNREKKVYRRLLKENKGPLPNQAVRDVYREIMSAALSLEKQADSGKKKSAHS